MYLYVEKCSSVLRVGACITDFPLELHKWLENSNQNFAITFLLLGFVETVQTLEKNVVIYKDINYVKQAAYKRDIDRVLLHGIVKMPATDIMSYCVYIL